MAKQIKIRSNEAALISQRMADVALKHNSDELANAYARTSVKLENLHAPFAEQLTDLDMKIIRTFVANYMQANG